MSNTSAMARRIVLAALGALIAGTALGMPQVAAAARVVQFKGPSGTAYVLTFTRSWRADFSGMATSGGRRFRGLAMELIGRSAKDGLTAMAVETPTGIHGGPGQLQALGAVRSELRKGRYLFVLVGDSPVSVALSVSVLPAHIVPTHRRPVVLREASGATAFEPQLTGLYQGHVSIPVAAATDPIVMSTWVVYDAAGPHTYDTADCMTRAAALCSAADSPLWGVGNQSTGSATMASYRIWDGTDGLNEGSGWSYRGDYRGSGVGSRLFAATIEVTGVNR